MNNNRHVITVYYYAVAYCKGHNLPIDYAVTLTLKWLNQLERMNDGR